jgi:cobalt-precorrin-5B (C1)-methyltransferase
VTRGDRPHIARGVTQKPPLRRGWTTGACATAAAKAAFTALCHGAFPDPVTITLPGGATAAFALAEARLVEGGARAAIVKDAGDDPDVTHGALVQATVLVRPAGHGIRFLAGPGVGMVTRPGLPIRPGEPAINPVPRRMIAAALAEVAEDVDVDVELSIPDGERIARQTLNPRLGIVGGLSILGTTGVVIPFSCAAWIDSIHRGIDVARAMGLGHVAGATGRTSEAAVQTLYGLPEVALIEMGDFVGGMLKYLRAHPVSRVTVAGGIGKMTKLAQGRLDLHSKRGGVDFSALAALAGGVAGIARANTAAEAIGLAAAAGVDLADAVARQAWTVAADVLDGAMTDLDVVVFDAGGQLLGRSDVKPVHGGSPPRNRRR